MEHGYCTRWYLSHICEKNNYAPVAKTGQTTSYATDDDGDLQEGTKWHYPRFADNGDGTVKDNLTGLIWLANANCFGARVWAEALSDSSGLVHGSCGLTDGSVAGDWRLPNIKELQSLVDLGSMSPALPSGHPFTGVQTSYYWSSTSPATSSNAWSVHWYYGTSGVSNKTLSYYVWPVRNDN